MSAARPQTTPDGRTGPPANATRPPTARPAATRPPARRSGVVVLLRRFPLISYFVLAYAISWTYVLVFLVAWPLPDTFITNTPELLGPVVAGFVMTAVTSGRAGVRDLLRRIVSWRHPARWYLVALVGVPVLYLASLALIPGALASFDPPGPAMLVIYPLLFPVMAFLYGPVLEEPGWRGFALPLLQQRWGPLAGSVVLGLAWAFWHAPQLLTDSFSAANGGGTLTGTAVFIVAAVCFSILITWAYNHTGGSVLIAVLIHTSINYTQAVSNDLFPVAGYNEVAPTAAFAVLAIVLVLVTRGRLGLPNASVQQPGHDAG